MEVTSFPSQYQCLVEGCPDKFKTSRDRKDHLVRRHLYPADYRFDKPRKSRGLNSPGATMQVSADSLGQDGEQSERGTMEICSEHTAPSREPASERRVYSHRSASGIFLKQVLNVCFWGALQAQCCCTERSCCGHRAGLSRRAWLFLPPWDTWFLVLCLLLGPLQRSRAEPHRLFTWLKLGQEEPWS